MISVRLSFFLSFLLSFFLFFLSFFLSFFSSFLFSSCFSLSLPLSHTHVHTGGAGAQQKAREHKFLLDYFERKSHIEFSPEAFAAFQVTE